MDFERNSPVEKKLDLKLKLQRHSIRFSDGYYCNMLQSMDELIIQGTSSFPRKMDKHYLCDDNKPSFKQSAGRVHITWDMEASNCFIMPHVHNLKG